MQMSTPPYYQLAPGIDVVPLDGEALLFRSATLAIKIDGSMAVVLRHRVLPLLHEPHRLDDLESRLPDLPRDDLKASLDSLVDARVLERSAVARALGPTHTLSTFAKEVGVDPVVASERLSRAHVAIFGLEAHGAHLAVELARMGLGACTLADPFPILERDALLMPSGVYKEGLTRQEAVARVIRERTPAMSVSFADDLSRESVTALAQSSTVLLGCFDRGYEAAQHWVNRAAIAANVPALFADRKSVV